MDDREGESELTYAEPWFDEVRARKGGELTASIAERLSAALHDRYRIERELGEGGMATVYLAHDLKHDRDVALKVLKPELALALGAERFLAEIRVMATLQHPNLLPLFDSGGADGLLFYVMPFFEGDTLRTRLQKEPQLPVDETIRLVALMAGALDFAHARGVIHRDLKPENILLQAGQPVIADFGIALAVAHAGGERITETGLSLGTPHYMSPEQATGIETVDARSDQYALGAVTYEMLVGEPPHSGATAQAIIARLMTETPRSIRAVRPTVPKGVEGAVLRALAKSPVDRFADCGEFANALSTGARDSAATHSRRRLTRVLAVVVLVVVATAVGYAAMTRRSPNELTAAAGATAERSLVVLPFTSVGGDTANTYFAAGIADELTSALTQIPGLRLAGRVSASRVKAEGRAAKEIGEALDVAAVLDGSVRRAGQRIRVSAELTSTTDGRVLWSETYERALEDVFAVQDEITRSIVAALEVRLPGGAGAGVWNARGGTADLAAYDDYLRALQLYRARGPGLVNAERALLAAVAADPGYAKAYALLSSVLLVQHYYYAVDVFDAQRRGRSAAERAVALDDSLAEAHTALGHVHTESFEWSDAERELRRGIELDPRSAEAHYRLAELLINVGRVREAFASLEEVNRLDPLYVTSVNNRAWVLSMLGRHEEATTEVKRALSLDPDNVVSKFVALLVFEHAGRRDELAAQARALAKNTSDALSMGRAAWGLARAGSRDEAVVLRERLEALPNDTFGRAMGLMHARIGLGDLRGALDAMEVAAETQPQRLVGDGLVSMNYDPLRAEPRFAAILKRFNLDVERLTLPDGGRSR